MDHDRVNPSAGRLPGMAGPVQFRLTREAARAIDDAATSRYAIPSILLMENAAAGLCREVMGVAKDPVTVVCGPGNNGGDGLALARHLDNAGVGVRVALTGEPRGYGGDAGVNMAIVEAMALPVIEATPSALEQARPGTIVDAMFGTGLTRAIEGAMAETIEWMNGSDALTVAVDIPSGLDADTGRALGAVVRADLTVTFVAPKAGFDALEAQAWLGEVRVVGIGAPRALLEAFGSPAPAGHPGGERAAPTDPGRRGRSV